MKTIVVPTDFSANAQQALQYALGLAADNRYRRLLLYHVFQMPYTTAPVITTNLVDIMLQDAHNMLNEQLQQARALAPPQLEVQALLHQGSIAQHIVNFSKKEKADLIVMGVRGSGSLSVDESILGSIASAVIGQAHCPVLSVPADALFKGWQKIVMATNYQESDLLLLEKLAALTAGDPTKIVILHIAKASGFREKLLLRGFEDLLRQQFPALRSQHLLLTGSDVNRVLEEYLQKHPADLVAMLTHTHSLFSRLVARSLTSYFAHHSRIPLLSLLE